MKLQQIFEKITNLEYVPFEVIQPYAKALKVLLLDYYGGSNLYVTLANVTNFGGYPLFFTDRGSLIELFNEFYAGEDMSSEEENNYLELLNHYTRSYDDLFSI
jgi:hypothetical protein